MYYDQEIIMNQNSKNNRSNLIDDDDNLCKTIPEILEAYMEQTKSQQNNNNTASLTTRYKHFFDTFLKTLFAFYAL